MAVLQDFSKLDPAVMDGFPQTAYQPVCSAAQTKRPSRVLFDDAAWVRSRQALRAQVTGQFRDSHLKGRRIAVAQSTKTGIRLSH